MSTPKRFPASLKSATLKLWVDADNALMLALDADKDGGVPGERLTYTLTYGNRATASARVASQAIW